MIRRARGRDGSGKGKRDRGTSELSTARYANAGGGVYCPIYYAPDCAMIGDNGDRYASVPERIAWTPVRRADKHLLCVLATFASFKTGKGARMSIDALAQRSGLPRRTVQRGLHRLEADGWIVAARRRHKRATVWDINVERLAENWAVPKAVTSAQSVNPLSARSGALGPVENILSATSDALSATSGALDGFLSAKSGAQIPCTYDPLSDHKHMGTSEIQLSLSPMDVAEPDAAQRVEEARALALAEIRARLVSPLTAALEKRRRHGGHG